MRDTAITRWTRAERFALGDRMHRETGDGGSRLVPRGIGLTDVNREGRHEEEEAKEAEK